MAKAIAEVRISLEDVLPVLSVFRAAQAYVRLPYNAPAYEVYEKRQALNDAVSACESWAQEGA